MSRGRGLARQAGGYALTGGTAAVVDIGGFAALDAGGVPLLPAAVLSWLVATVVNYGLSARFVFEAAPSLRGYLRFVVAASAGLLVNVAVTAAVAAWTPAPPVLAKTVGVGVAFVANFLLNALVVFRRRG